MLESPNQNEIVKCKFEENEKQFFAKRVQKCDRLTSQQIDCLAFGNMNHTVQLRRILTWFVVDGIWKDNERNSPHKRRCEGRCWMSKTIGAEIPCSEGNPHDHSSLGRGSSMQLCDPYFLSLWKESPENPCTVLTSKMFLFFAGVLTRAKTEKSLKLGERRWGRNDKGTSSRILREIQRGTD